MARTTGKAAVCFATSGPGVTNLITAIADAKLDSVPLVAITGQVASSMIGTDAFQEVDTFGMTMNITKHNYLVKDVGGTKLSLQHAKDVSHIRRWVIDKIRITQLAYAGDVQHDEGVRHAL
jgi:thiamine pyrophosphate-dependent acetolactate synthase large subunit-like protein